MSLLNFKDIARIFEKIELRLIDSLKRNLKRHKSEEEREGFEWSAWQAEKIRSIDNFRRENKEIVEEYVDIIDDQTRQLMEDQFVEGERLAEEQVNMVGERPERSRVRSPEFFGVNTAKMEKLMDDITDLENRAETSALRMVDDIYRQTLNRVQLAMGTGSMTLDQAIDSATKDFLDKGINSVEYSDGKRVNIADYVRMALRTTSARATLQGQAKRFSELGYDTVMTSQYSMCSKTCEPWQGRAYIDDVYTSWSGETEMIDGVLHGRSHYCGKWFPLLSEAIRQGLFHPNCRHTLLLYVEGRTKPPEPIPADDLKRLRDLERKQRALERKIRKLKRHKAGTMDPDTAKAYGKQLKEAQKELRDFIKQTNSNEEATILRRDGPREKSSAAELTEKEKDDIIKAEKMRSLLREKIESGELPITVNPEKQVRHILPAGASKMPDGRSHLIISFQEAQEEIIKRHLTGDIHVRISPSGIQIKETIESNRDISFDARSKTVSNRATIHYSKTGTHLVPARRRNKS